MGSIFSWLDTLLSWLRSMWDRWFGPVVTLDSGIQCRIGRPIAEGGFSIVYRATPIGKSSTNHNASSFVGSTPHGYALKRILCMDSEMRNACLHESEVYYAVRNIRKEQDDVTYTMPLLGMTFTTTGGNSNSICYMLFPYYPHSLRHEVNQRIFHPLQDLETTRRQPPLTQSQKLQKMKDVLTFQPWNESIVLQMFGHLCQAVQQLHSAGYTHRDIKVENVLLKGSSNTQHLTQPVLMDFGSAGPLSRSLTTRRDVLDIAEQASQHTTVSYRPPELFPGELRPNNAASMGKKKTTTTTTSILDYTKCDVWMLGCTLFATLYGASPGECEFSRSSGQLRVVECSHNKVLGPIPEPYPDTPPAKWYSPQIKELIEWMLTQNRHDRPTLGQVQSRIELLLRHRNDGNGRNINGDSNMRINSSLLDAPMDMESQADILFT